jgi:hypothetical protein
MNCFDKKEIRVKVAVFTVIIFIVLSLFSCKKEDEQVESGISNQTDSGTMREESSSRERPQRTLTLELEQEQDIGKEEGEVREEEAVAATLPPTFKEKLLALRNGEPVLPEDFVIGNLQSTKPEDRDRQIVVEKAESFSRALVRGAVPEVPVHPEWRDDMKRALWYHQENSAFPKKIRIGEIIIDGSTARANMRLIGDQGRAAGELFFELAEGEWYITDIQADFSKLDRPYTRDKQFEPSIYQWLESQ